METGVKAVLVRHMPEDLHKAAKVCAVSAGISLEQWIIQAIRRQVGEDQPNITLVLNTTQGESTTGTTSVPMT
jgi:hypothetical protein